MMAALGFSARICGIRSRPLWVPRRRSRKTTSYAVRPMASSAACADAASPTSPPIPSMHTRRVWRMFFSSSMMRTVNRPRAMVLSLRQRLAGQQAGGPRWHVGELQDALLLAQIGPAPEVGDARGARELDRQALLRVAPVEQA